MSGDALPAHDIAAERAVLGAMMLSEDVRADCLGILAPGAGVFFRPAHQLVYEVICWLAGEGHPVDIYTVRAELERRGQITKTGGADYLHTLIASVPVAAHGPHYADRLLDHYTSRAIAGAAERIRQIAGMPGLDRAERADQAREALDAATVVTPAAAGIPLPELLGPALDDLQAGPDTTRGVISGWRDLDRVIPGFRPGEVVIVGGRPGMGKSVVMLNIAVHAGVHMQIPVLLRSLEMSRAECMERIISAEAGVDLTRIRDHLLTDHDWDLIRKAHGRLDAAADFIINDSPETGIQGIRSELRAMRRGGRPAQLVVVDYLQIMTSAARAENRQAEVSALSRDLKLLAREFEVPVIVGSQINRGPEMRADHRPVLADLRDSGAVEQDCDIAILLYRDDAYEDDSPRSGEIDLIVAKNRQGPKVTVTLAWRGHYAMCSDLYRDDSGINMATGERVA